MTTVVARRGVELFVDVVGEVLAFFTILLMAFMYVNGKFGFVKGDLLTTLTYVREIAMISTIGLKAIEFALKRGIILTVITVAIVVTIIVFLFFPEALPQWAFNFLPADGAAIESLGLI
jgi:hypothetical protein